jgi:hypothetical protein
MVVFEKRGVKHNAKIQDFFPTCFGSGLGFYSPPQQLNEGL